MILELRQYDKTLLLFEFLESELDGKFCKILSVDENLRYLLPLGIEVSDEGVLSWLKSRVIPKNREFVDNLLAKYGLSHNNTLGIITLCKGLSLNDSYWIVEQGFIGEFKDFNLFENEFSKILSLVAYTGYGSGKIKGFTSSPEFTTNGMLKKAWRKLGDKTILYKGGTMGAANAGKEPYSEFYASDIADVMGLNHVRYGLSMWKKSICSTCELFTSIDISFVPIYRLVKKGGLNGIANYFKSLGENNYNEFVDMLIFDALIYNTDRHLGNFGIMVNNQTNTPVSIAPIFDNGLSLFNYAMDDDLKELPKYAKSRTSAFDVAFETIVKEYLSDRQRLQLRKMLRFKFTRHSSYNLREARLKAIETFMQMRASELLNIKG